MNYSLGNIISNGGVLSRFNPIAVARINAIYAAGGSAPVGQRTATQLLSDFINAEQSSGRWAQHRNIFIPGWGNAAANAIGIVTGSSGSFSVSGVTHGLGFVQGNGTSGWFDFGVTPTQIGITNDSGALAAICTQAPTGVSVAGIINSIDGSDATRSFFIDHQSGTALQFGANNNSSGAITANVARADQVGVIVASRQGGARRIHQLRSSGFTTLTNTVGASAGTVPTTRTLQAMRSSFGGGLAFSNGRYGAFCASLGLTTAEAQAFSLNLRTLWQGLFQLSLP